jgi:hypothetical protein
VGCGGIRKKIMVEKEILIHNKHKLIIKKVAYYKIAQK